MKTKLHRDGMALVITLCALVLMTGLILSFFSNAILNRQIAFSSANQWKAEQMARSSLDYIVGELRQEIVDGSVVPDDVNKLAQGGTTVYLPKPFDPNEKINFSMPQKVGVDEETLDAAGKFTVVKISAAGAGVRPSGQPSGSTISIDVPSVNGRSLSPARWFDAQAGGPGLGSQGTLPVWTYVTRSGVKVPTDEAARDRNSADYAVGRFAYTVYNTSGLLDANAAGYPSSVGPNENRKSSIAYCDLSALDPAFDSQTVDRFLSWRNGEADTATAGAYENHLEKFAYKHGFSQTKQGHNVFLSRKDFLNAMNGPLSLPAESAQLFTHFCAASNAPSWSPRSDEGIAINPPYPPYSPASPNSSFGPQADYNYKSNADREFDSLNQPVANRNIGNVRVVTPFTRPDGTAAVPGDALVVRQFPLDRLELLSKPKPLPPQVAAQIRQFFGLEWGNDDSGRPCWKYVEDDGVREILTLGEVAILGREPNFFELLKCGILSGSLGRDPGPGCNPKYKEAYSQANPAQKEEDKALDPNYRFNVNTPGREGPIGNDFNLYSANKEMHLLQIAANIIDQYDGDSYPTALYFEIYDNKLPVPEKPLNTVYGIENLPCLAAMHMVVWQPDDTSGLNFWYQPQLWNPFQIPTVTMDRPTMFRVRAYGKVLSSWGQRYPDGGRGGNELGMNFNDNPETAFIYFNDQPGRQSMFYERPTPLSTASVDLTRTSPLNISPHYFGAPKYDDGTDPKLFVGFHTARFDYKTSTVSPPGPYPNKTMAWDGVKIGTANSINMLPDPIVTFCLEYLDPVSGSYLPYSYCSRLLGYLAGSANAGGASEVNTVRSGIHGHDRAREFVTKPDPMTDRFSAVYMDDHAYANPSPSSKLRGGESFWPTTLSGGPPGRTIHAGFPRRKAGFSYRNVPSNNSPNLDVFTGDWGIYLGAWSLNQPSDAPLGQQMHAYYKDPDGVVRPADAFRCNVYSGEGCRLYRGGYDTEAPGNATAIGSARSATIAGRRPLILNRPFRSVAELGYTYRDLPFRSLDLFTEKSADAALLDLFCVNDEPPRVAGRLNPIAAPTAVLKSVFSGAVKSELPISPSYNITPGQSAALAEGVVLGGNGSTELAGPPYNQSELPTFLSGALVKAFTAEGDLAAKTYKPDLANKTFAESPIRALSAVSDTRTWRLLIDVVAQSGKVAKDQSLDKFVVQGECRYWLHIAIDRYTGRIVQQQLERVYE